MGRGLVAGDLDHDGREDLVILSHNQPLAYLHNRSEVGRYLSLRLDGSPSNRDAVGTSVTVIAAGQRRTAWRVGGGSFQSGPDPHNRFGLGPADTVEAVEVRWASGRFVRYTRLRPDSSYVLREAEEKPREWLLAPLLCRPSLRESER
jgi:hypothetical protein